uniref:Immunoglobulin domain-containing protein n=1 Tax=Denticeps clupeoides TaxID=299321 RepID=A0AAY4A215_9TELE
MFSDDATIPEISKDCSATECTLKCSGSADENVSWLKMKNGNNPEEEAVPTLKVVENGEFTKFQCKLSKPLSYKTSKIMTLQEIFQAQEYGKTGGSITLTPRIKLSTPPNTILWKWGTKKVAEKDRPDLPTDYYGWFQGRTTLDDNTGSLTIYRLSSGDDGDYSVEINGQLKVDKYQLIVKDDATIPEISKDYSATECTLKCSGSADENVSWLKMKNGNNPEEEAVPTLKVVENGEFTKFQCKLSKPLSYKTSKIMTLQEIFQAQEYGKTGGSITLTPRIKLSTPPNTILWKWGTKKVAEKDSPDLPTDYYGWFQGRTTLDDNTGSLTIYRLSSGDDGDYSVEINGQLKVDKYHLIVKDDATIPEISKNCSATECTLKCSGSADENVSWLKMKNGNNPEEEAVPTLKVYKNSTFTKFQCKLSKPLSYKTSAIMTLQEIFQESNLPNNSGLIIGIILPIVAVLVCVAVFGYFKGWYKRFLPGQRDSGTTTIYSTVGSTGLNTTQSNNIEGDATPQGSAAAPPSNGSNNANESHPLTGPPAAPPSNASNNVKEDEAA